MGTLIQNHKIIPHFYIHIPFCAQKCAYCSFYSTPFSENALNEYLSLLHTELEFYKTHYTLNLQTLYIGGGTPSLLSLDQLSQILSVLDLSSCKEITIECNPNSLTLEKLKGYQRLGINRISMGIQSFQNHLLNYLGRIHDENCAKNALDLIEKSGFSNYSIDLIYGIPGQTREDFLKDLTYCIDKNVPHISFYCLSLDEDVPLYKDIDRLPDDDLIHEMYYSAQELLTQHHYQQYEFSNFALNHQISNHNYAYWIGKYYLGAGPSASSYIGDSRMTHPESLSDYANIILNENYDLLRLTLTDKDRIEEYIITRLRTSEGLDINEFNRLFEIDFLAQYKKLIDKYLSLEMIAINNNHLTINPSAYLISNEILADFL